MPETRSAQLGRSADFGSGSSLDYPGILPHIPKLALPVGDRIHLKFKVTKFNAFRPSNVKQNHVTSETALQEPVKSFNLQIARFFLLLKCLALAY